MIVCCNIQTRSIFFFIPAGCRSNFLFRQSLCWMSTEMIAIWRGINTMQHQGNLHLFNISLLLACVLFLNSLPALWLDLCISICKLKCFWFPLSRVEIVRIVGFSFITHLWSWYCLSFFPLGTTINPLLYFLLIGIIDYNLTIWL
jgi:hypothetical protein